MNKSLQALSLAAALAVALPQAAQASAVTLDFEGAADLAQIGTLYKQQYGVDFSMVVGGTDVSSGAGLHSKSAGGSGNFVTDPAKNPGSGALFRSNFGCVVVVDPISGSSCDVPDIEFTVAAGFTGQLKFLYASADDPFFVRVFGHDANGQDWVVGDTFNANQIGGCGSFPTGGNIDFCQWSEGSIDFSGENGNAYRVQISGLASKFLIDNIQLDANSPTDPGTKVPEPTSLALVALALAGAGASVRRRRA